MVNYSGLRKFFTLECLYHLSEPNAREADLRLRNKEPSLSQSVILTKHKSVRMAHIIWLRNDLRIIDHDIFHHLQDQPIIPLYIFDPREHASDAWGHSRLGKHRRRFLMEGLQALREELQSRGSDLCIRHGYPAEVIEQMHQQYTIEGIHVYGHDAYEERQQEEAAKKLGIPFHLYEADTLYHPADLPFPIEKMPFVFTDFRKKMEKQSEVRPFHPTPKQFVKPEINLDWGDIPKVDYKIDSRSAFPFRGGTRAALDRLEHYFWETDQLAQYKNTRNGLLGTDYSSKFSPWLAQGAISARFIYHQVKKYESLRTKNQSTYWLIFELIWRDFFRFTAKSEGNRFFRIPREVKAMRIPAFELWKSGQTGEPFIDANMKELAATGFMSNRGRQNVGSYLVHQLNVPWYAGAAWFESQLIDYDVYSNWGNWTYVAGVGHDPRSRVFNISRQQSMYDPEGAYVEVWGK